MDILASLIADHRWFYEQVALLDAKVFDYANKYYAKDWAKKVEGPAKEVLGSLLARMARHEKLEHEVLFPALIEHNVVERAVLERMEKDHAGINRGLRQFMDAFGLPEEQLGREKLLRLLRLVNLVQQHMIREETEVFDPARAALSWDVLERLGERAAACACASR